MSKNETEEAVYFTKNATTLEQFPNAIKTIVNT